MQRLDIGIFDALKNSKDGRKALALFIVLKHIYRAGGIRNYSPNSLRKFLGMHIDTVKRLMGVLIENGLCEFVGRDSKTLRLRSIRTGWKDRDIDISFIRFNLRRREDGAFADVRYIIDRIAKELVAVYILDVNKRRDYARRLVSSSVNPNSKCEYVRAEKERRRRGYDKIFANVGISYEGLAKRLGMSVQTAFYSVQYAVNSGLLAKQSNIMRIDTTDKEHRNDMIKAIDAKFDKNKSFTYICGRFVYFVGANDYHRGPNAVHIPSTTYRTSIHYKI